MIEEVVRSRRWDFYPRAGMDIEYVQFDDDRKCRMRITD